MTIFILDMALWSLGFAWLFHVLQIHEVNARIEALHDANAALIQYARKQTAWIDGLEAMNRCLRGRIQRLTPERDSRGRFI